MAPTCPRYPAADVTPSSASRRELGAPSGLILVSAFFFIVVLVRTTIPLIDGDAWWHLRAGETILATRAVPATDTWTIAGAGMRWISQDWLSNVVMAAVLGLGGTWGATLLSLVFGALVVLAFAMLWDAIQRRHPEGSWVGRTLLLSAGLVVAGPILGVRVQTIDLTMTALTVWLLWGYLADRRDRWLICLPLAAAAWANLHAGWPLLFALGGAMVVGEAADRLTRRRLEHDPLTYRQIVRLSAALALAVAAIMLNPSGPVLYGYPFTTAGIGAHRDFLFEWSRPDLSSFPGQVLLGFLLLVVVPTLFVGRRSLRAVDALWLIGLGTLSIGAIRFGLVIGPVGAAVAAVVLAPALARFSALRGGARVAASIQRPARTPRLALLNVLLASAVGLLGVGIATARVAPPVQAAAIAESMPVAATSWLRQNLPDARIFNVYAWGGYLGRELPEALVYIDGRADIYGDAPIREYARAIALETDPAPLLDRAGIDTVVFWPETALASWLDEQPAWSRAYTDEQAVIWVRSNED